MSTVTASQTTTSKERPSLLRLPFAAEPIILPACPAPPRNRATAFKPGAWEMLVVAAELDRESRELCPSH